MENFPQLVPLIILVPAVGAFINFVWGGRSGEKFAGAVANIASGLSFVIAFLMYLSLANNGFVATVVDPPFFKDWLLIPSAGIDIPWQMRVDTLSVTMMLVITGVGSLIHVYCLGYIHGDPKAPRFFAYMNMFLAFMLILVTGNNFLMMFVGWEGVGLCSYLLIGFWWDKRMPEGWSNSNAARKAFIANRVGDFGLLLGIFLTFWTFGTLDFYKPGEVPNPHFFEELAHEEAGEHGEEAVVGEGEHGEAVVVGEGEHGEEAVVGEGEHGEEGHEEELLGFVTEDGEAVLIDFEAVGEENLALSDLGVFKQVERLVYEAEASGEPHMVQFGPFEFSLGVVLTFITLFFLIGATGKSAQIPLFVWLPDAMAGPTPASALIHAATMVTAGIYMMTRANVMYYNAPVSSFIVTIIGVGTALVAGFIAIGQWDIKRVLAYSTVSQLGFMVAAVGVGAFSAAIFHLVTHAFFKALLFLGSGSVIHAMEHGHHHLHEHGHDDEHAHDEDHVHDEFDPQDMRYMGGLRRKMPVTFWTYMFATLALAGIFPFAGFWSKDEILADAWLVGVFDGDIGGFIALPLLLVAAGFTAFYMWRQMELVFFGEPRHEAAEHAPESAPSMTIPLAVLGFFAIFVGFINTPHVLGLHRIFGEHRLTHWLEASVVHAHAAEFQWLLAIVALVIGLAAIFLARSIYGSGKALTEEGTDPLYDNRSSRPAWVASNARLWWDDAYDFLFIQPYTLMAGWFANWLDWKVWHDGFHNGLARLFKWLSGILANPLDQGLIDGTVNGIGRLINWFSARESRIQTGYVRTYAVTLFLGVIFVIVLLLIPMLTNAGS